MNTNVADRAKVIPMLDINKVPLGNLSKLLIQCIFLATVPAAGA